MKQAFSDHMIRKVMLMIGSQLRAARALLGWSAEALAEASKVGVATIRRAEGEAGAVRMTAANTDAIRRALEEAGAVLIEDEHIIGAALRKVSQ